MLSKNPSQRDAELQIKRIDIRTSKNSEEVWNIQIPAYKIEAELIGFDEIPPLKDTVHTLQHCGETFFGYYDKEELCGVISIKADDREMDIHRLVVHPNHFKKGIAQALLNFVEAEFQVKTIKVATGSKNTPAIRFYLKNGFRMVREIKVHDQLSLSYFERNM